VYEIHPGGRTSLGPSLFYEWLFDNVEGVSLIELEFQGLHKAICNICGAIYHRSASPVDPWE
jgi:hypothetical protein